MFPPKATQTIVDGGRQFMVSRSGQLGSQLASDKVSLIPFGKYKNQPVAVLANDRSYTDWLVGQEWFRHKYCDIYSVVINNFGEPQDTPEHNAIQTLFLDNPTCWKVYAAAFPKSFAELALMIQSTVKWFVDILTQSPHNRYVITDAINAHIASIEAGSHRWQDPNLPNVKSFVQHIKAGIGWFPVSDTCDDSVAPEPGLAHVALGDQNPTQEVSDLLGKIDVLKTLPWAWRTTLPSLSVSAKRFEALDGWDVQFWLNYVRRAEELAFGQRWRQINVPTWSNGLRVEVKPSIGDDFPGVLRQIKRRPHVPNSSAVLVVRNIQSEVATFQNISDMFRLDGITIITVDEILAANVDVLDAVPLTIKQLVFAINNEIHNSQEKRLC